MLSKIRNLLFCCFFAALFFPAAAQVEIYEDFSPEIALLYTRERVFEAGIHSAGFHIGYRQGKYNSRHRFSAWEFSAGNLRASKQQKVQAYGSMVNNDLGYSFRYVWGRMNQLFDLRAGRNWRFALAEKPRYGGLQVEFVMAGGFTLGIAKPQYLYIRYATNATDPGAPAYERKLERYDPDNAKHHDYSSIHGAAPFYYGIFQSSLHPGAYLKAGLNFEFGNFADKVRAVEAGVILDGMIPAVQQMAYNDARNLFFNFYINYQFGKRYNEL